MLKSLVYFVLAFCIAVTDAEVAADTCSDLCRCGVPEQSASGYRCLDGFGTLSMGVLVNALRSTIMWQRQVIIVCY